MTKTIYSALEPALVVAHFIGLQPTFAGCDRLELWNLEVDIHGHSRGSTVCRQTLEKAGYAVPVVGRDGQLNTFRGVDQIS
jgi:hypothetical protein